MLPIWDVIGTLPSSHCDLLNYTPNNNALYHDVIIIAPLLFQGQHLLATLPDAVACKCNFLYLGNVQLTSRLGLLLTFDALLPTHSLTFDSYSGISSQQWENKKCCQLAPNFIQKKIIFGSGVARQYEISSLSDIFSNNIKCQLSLISIKKISVIWWRSQDEISSLSDILLNNMKY
jgi:hypothetical protein